MQVGCFIEPRRPVKIGEVLTFSATQSPSGVPVRYAFDHGDGTIDPSAVSRAFYANPGSYSVVLRWELNGAQGSVSCGTVDVLPEVPTVAFNGAAYMGRTEAEAVAIARSQGFAFLRVVRRDSVWIPTVNDFRADRVNVELDNGLVTGVGVG